MIFAKNSARNYEKKIILGTSDAWTTSHLSQGTSKPAYYIVDCRILNLQERNLNTDWKCSYNFFIYCLKLTLQSHFEIDFEIAYLKLKKAKCKCNKMYLDANFIISSGLLK